MQISALSRALRINVKVAYLDGRGDGEKVDFVELKNVEEGYNGMNEVVLLYRCVPSGTLALPADTIAFRPGHYDTLEYRESDD